MYTSVDTERCTLQLTQRDVHFSCFWWWCWRWNLYNSYALCVSPTQKSSNFSMSFPRSCVPASCPNLNPSKYVHRVFSDSCQKYSALKLIRFLIKPARNWPLNFFQLWLRHPSDTLSSDGKGTFAVYCLLCMVDYIKRKNEIIFSQNDVILMFFMHLLASLVLSESVNTSDTV